MTSDELHPKLEVFRSVDRIVLLSLVISSWVHLAFSYNSKCKDIQCVNGECVNGTCVCRDGWQGPLCQHCGGKVRLSNDFGYIYDSIGNYSIDTKCSWLIDAGNSNSTIRLHVEQFITECGWDYLYIFDGDSIHSPMAAVLSGYMYATNYTVKRVPDIVTTSGYALVHFYSDIAVNNSGFNISYRINSCPSRDSSVNCSGNGVCIDGVCTCDAMFLGEACDIPVCPNNCTFDNGVCHTEYHRCDCKPMFKGDDCSQLTEEGYWEVIQPKDFVPHGSASHTAVVWRDSMYILGGESYNKGEMIYVYDFNGNVWETPHMDSKNVPGPRHGHSSVLFGDKIYMYGGIMPNAQICNELWALDVSAKTWENITVRSDPCFQINTTTYCGPLKSAGHSATLFTNKSRKSEVMIVMFGLSPVFGFLNTVQEYHFGTREWKIVKTKGFPAKGGYGHSSAWDPLTQKIYVFGGYVSTNLAAAVMSDRLYSYEPNTRTWRLLMSAPTPRYLHTALFVDGLMLVYGGNAYNGTMRQEHVHCYARDLLTYDPYCDMWSVTDVPPMLRVDLARFGHSAVIFDGSLYMYGGFNGQMMNDIVKFTPGKCLDFTSHLPCLNAKLGIKCIWDRSQSKCLPNTAISRSKINESLDRTDDLNPYQICSEGSRSKVFTSMTVCTVLKDCQSCIETSLDCGWCPLQRICVKGNRCREPGSPNSSSEGILKPYLYCHPDETVNCNVQHTCQACIQLPYCHWYKSHGFCVPLANLTLDEQSLGGEPLQLEVGTCPFSCSDYTSCLNCTNNGCLWCHNAEICIEKNAYLPYFPYGECREWTSATNRCRSPTGPGCGFYKSCTDCQSDPECGWCDDNSGTGLGSCLPGGNTHPQNCPKDNWYFTRCPGCQCNGHSTCTLKEDTCNQPCYNFTAGAHCDRCATGFFGNPSNGGTCWPCFCNHHATQCNMETGRCFCSTKGIIGDRCEKCDVQNHYHGDPTLPGSTCFYELTIDYQFTFNLSKKDDRHYKQINFKNTPPKMEVDADFSITCSVPAKMNITKKIGSGNPTGLETTIIERYNCTNYRTKFSKADYTFGPDDNSSTTTFYVYVYDFHPPLWIQISFSQYPKLNLQQFFITFSSCFLLLLLLAAVSWKLKQRYDNYRRRQRIIVEMVQMARRPFPSVKLAIDHKKSADHIPGDRLAATAGTTQLRRRKKAQPYPIAVEPCANNKAAVVTFLVKMPTGDDLVAPPGQPGMAVASALVTLGNSTRGMGLDPATITKNEGKIKGRKYVVTNQNVDS